MAQARTAAREGKLIVIPTAILPPEPSSLPPGSMGQQVDAYNASQEKKQRAFEEAKATVEAARTQQDEAHQALEKAMKDPLATVKTTKTYAMFVVGQGLSTIKASTDAAGELFQKADRWNDVASTLQARAIQHSGHVRDLFTRAAASHEKVADAATTRAANAQKLGGPVGPKARAIISADASDLVKSTSKVGQFGSKALRGVPFVGTGVTLISGGVDVAMGKDVWETAEDTTTDLAGGAAGGWAGAAIGTAICPGGGTVIGGVVGGIAGSMLATSGVNAATGE